MQFAILCIVDTQIWQNPFASFSRFKCLLCSSIHWIENICGTLAFIVWVWLTCSIISNDNYFDNNFPRNGSQIVTITVWNLAAIARWCGWKSSFFTIFNLMMKYKVQLEIPGKTSAHESFSIQHAGLPFILPFWNVNAFNFWHLHKVSKY